MRKVTSANYKQGPLYPGAVRAVSQVLETKDSISPIDLLIASGRLTPRQPKGRREGRIHYLERVVRGNLENEYPVAYLQWKSTV